MDAPDAPLDFKAADLAAGDPSNEEPRALSTPCPHESIADRMAAGILSTEEIRGPGRQLVRHLLRGCPNCAVAFRLAAGMPPVTQPLPLFYYEARVDRGIRHTLEDWQGRSEKTLERERAGALVVEARKLRRDDPEFGLELLDEALRRAKIAGKACTESGKRPGDLACEIYTERANLFRLLGRHLEAERAFQLALAAWTKESGNPGALLYLGDLYGSFLIARRRFDEADILFGRLAFTFSEQGDAARAGKLAISRMQAAIYANELQRALRYSIEAMALLRGEPDLLELRLNAFQHNIVLNVRLGDFQEASECADLIRDEYHRHMGDGDRAKFRWLDAQIYDRLGRHNIAEDLLRRAKRKFEQLGMPFQAALVGLDLAVTLVHRRRSAEARALIVGELIPTFRAIGVAREGIASLVLLEHATEAAALDAALLKSVLRDLERAGQERGPKRREDGADDEEPDSA